MAIALEEKACPKCGKRMQLVSTSPSSFLFACYKHSETFYQTFHHNLNEDGSVKAKDDLRRLR